MLITSSPMVTLSIFFITSITAITASSIPGTTIFSKATMKANTKRTSNISSLILGILSFINYI